MGGSASVSVSAAESLVGAPFSASSRAVSESLPSTSRCSTWLVADGAHPSWSSSCNFLDGLFLPPRSSLDSSSGIVGEDTVVAACPESRFHSSNTGNGDRNAGCCSVGGTSAGTEM